MSSLYLHAVATGGRAFVAPSDRFDILGKIGAGGMGVVYRAFDRKRGIEVALKTVSRSTGKALYRFKREFRSIADVSHPNLVTLYELHTDSDEWFFTMELVTGQSFAEYVRPYRYEAPAADHTISNTGDMPIDESMASDFADEEGTKDTGLWKPWPKGRQRIREGTLDVARLTDALAQLVDGIYALHRVGKVHRDLKPTNVLVDADGRVVILDFGLTADKLNMEADHTHSTAFAVGTPMYMSPEQAADVPLNEASDWYSVGIMLYEALTGYRPFEKLKSDAIFLAKQTEDIRPPCKLAADVPPALNDLCMALLDKDPRHRPTAKQILASLDRELSASAVNMRGVVEQPFVGRARELAQLVTAYQQSRDRSVCVMLSGESGMGKSVLIRRFLEEIPPGDSAVVLQGRCYEREVVPHKTLDSLVDALTRQLMSMPEKAVAALSPPDLDALATLFPVVKRVAALTRPSLSSGGRDPQETRRRAFTALRQILSALALHGPLIIHIDDIQWGDTESTGFLTELLDRNDAPRVLLIAGFRSNEADNGPIERLRVAAEDSALARVAQVSVGAFDADTVLELVEAVRPGFADKAHIERLLRESGGTPLFVAELIRRMGTTSDDQGDYTLARLLEDRVAALRPEERALLEVCCVAGRPMPPSVLVTAAQQTGEGRAVAVLRREQLIRTRHNDAELDETIEPFHDKLRHVVTELLSTERRREIHRRLALTMELVETEDAISQVAHWIEAGDSDRATDAAMRAARESEQMLAFHLAAGFYELVLEHSSAGETERRGIRASRAHALKHAGMLDEAEEEYRRAAEGAPKAEMLDYGRMELEQILRRGHLERGIKRANELLKHVGRKLPGSRLSAITSLLFNRLRLKMSGMHYEMRGADELDPEDLLRLDVEWSVSSAMAFVSPFQGRALQMQFVREALHTGSPKHVAQALGLEVGYLALSGVTNRERCEELRRRALDVADDLGDEHVIGLLETGAGIASFLCGRWPEAYKRLTAAEQYLRDNAAATARWEIDMAQAFRAAAMLYLGRFRELGNVLPIYIQEAEERGDVFATRNLRGQRSNLLWLALDQPAEALRHVDDVSAGTDEFHLHHYYELLARTQIALYQGRAKDAYNNLESLWRDLEKSQLLRVQTVRVEGWCMRGRAAMALALEVDGAERSQLLSEVERAVKHVAKEKLVWGNGLAELLRASLHAATDDNKQRLRALKRAIDAFDDSGMASWAAIARLSHGKAWDSDKGRQMATEATEALRAEGIVDPDKFAAMFAPGA